MTVSNEELRKKQLDLSAKVSSLASGTLMLNMRYMAKAVSRLRQLPYEGSYRCDGRTVCYDPSHLLARYKQSERLPVHDYLHMLLHCVFRHWHTGGGIDRARWDAACDIVTEAAIMRVAADFCDIDAAAEKSAVISELSLTVKPFTAEKLYAYFTANELSKERAEEYRRIFSVDDHAVWYPEPPKTSDDEEPPHIFPEITDSEDERQENDGGESSDGSGADGEQQSADDGQADMGEDNGAERDTSLEQYLENEYLRQQRQLDESWRELAREIRSELESFGSDAGKDTQHLVQMLEHIDRERYDYADFLRRFAVTGEVMRADLDAFEPGFYSYGLSLYGNVALIEPPEYKETRLVRDFVIAVDTSGSVRGDLVQSFMRKTYSILKSTESFFAKVNVFIIQCDTEVREAVRLNSLSELERYIANAEIKGLGGTDFRPVFELVDELRKSGRLSRLKGMVYFTDGQGIFPEKRPPYDTAFAFIGKPPEDIPPWAIKIVLEQEDISDDR